MDINVKLFTQICVCALLKVESFSIEICEKKSLLWSDWKMYALD